MDWKFLPKNENISGKTLDFVYQQTCGFGNVFSKNSGLAFLFCQKTEIFMEINDPIVLVIFFAKKLDWHFFWGGEAKKLKLARHQNWQKHEKCDFGQLVLIC